MICFGLFLMVETDVKQAPMLKVILITGDIQAKQRGFLYMLHIHHYTSVFL